LKPLSPYEVSRAILEDLNAAFQDLRDSIGPQVSLVYKEVSYESLSDPQFRAGLEEALHRKGKQALVDELFSEYDAGKSGTVAAARPNPARGVAWAKRSVPISRQANQAIGTTMVRQVLYPTRASSPKREKVCGSSAPAELPNHDPHRRD
jgi:hypothetical protein